VPEAPTDTTRPYIDLLLRVASSAIILTVFSCIYVPKVPYLVTSAYVGTCIDTGVDQMAMSTHIHVYPSQKASVPMGHLGRCDPTMARGGRSYLIYRSVVRTLAFQFCLLPYSSTRATSQHHTTTATNKNSQHHTITHRQWQNRARPGHAASVREELVARMCTTGTSTQLSMKLESTRSTRCPTM